MLLSADSLTIILSKSIATEPGLLELLQKVAGVRFFLDTVYVDLCGLAIAVSQHQMHTNISWIFSNFIDNNIRKP